MSQRRTLANDSLKVQLAANFIFQVQLLLGELVLEVGDFTVGQRIFHRYRDLVYIDDVVDAWLRAIEAPSSIGGTYNVGTGQKTTVRVLVDGLLRATGHAPGTVPVTVTTPEGSTQPNPNDEFTYR